LAGVLADSTNLVISEIYYNEPGPNEANEFIELTNISGVEINLSNLTVTAGLTYTIPVGITLSPGAQFVLRPTDYEGNLDNDGETITLNDASGAIIESFTYLDQLPWPPAGNGDGFSLVRVSPSSQLNPNTPTSWRASTTAGGNAGSSDTTTFPGGDAEALLSYALGSNELIPGAALGSIIVPRKMAADDLISIVQTSTDLNNWIDLTEVQNESLPVDGFSVQSYQAATNGTERFFRIKVMLRE
jgi:hypothetical protein